MTGAQASPLISVRALSKSFEGPAGRPLPVLEDINLDVAEGEFVALLGRSGSGKSTLLRCIAGLIAPTAGEVLFRGRRLTGSNRETTMVFQTFALLPWLTVQQNVELGLEARGVAPAQRSERALRAIDVVGLDGYESAYPKELSGGMRQRVGFARALVVEPAALLMDEPFSALDVLTSENLRGELLELWEGQRFPTKTMVMVTHNIEDAVLLADRILVLGTNPGRIRADLRNPLPRPRRRRTPEFEELVDQIYRMMTQRDQAGAAVPPAAAGGGRGQGTVSDTPLPRATVDGLSGLAEIMLGRHGGAADLADLADSLGLEVDDLLPLVDALVLLGFAELHDDRLQLSAAGRVFAGASIQDSKEIFARASLDRAPLVRTIYRALRGSIDGNLPAGFFTDILRTSFSEEDSASQLDVAVNWGRYAELYDFDAARDQVIREDQGIGATLPEAPAPARHGRLTVYLGAAPGSGKTFTMLREGRALRSQGADVVIGDVDTRGRPRTAEAVGGLETVPPSAADGHLDAAAMLARRPDVALVDDLGANTAGIAALRDAGIDVITTADVADVQATAAAAAAATGREPAATIPDEVLAGADEIQFVDNSPEALQKRLSHGNIYPPEQARAAMTGEFQTATLAALRELGLRLVADTLPAPLSRPREPRDVLVAVTGPDRARSLARRGVRLARRADARCTVLLLGPAGHRSAAAARIAELDADLPETERDGDTVTVIPQAVREAGARHLILAAPGRGLLDWLRGSAVERLCAQLPDVHLHVVPPLPPAGAPLPQGGAGVIAAGTIAPRGPAPRPVRAPVRVYLGYAPGVGTTTAMLGEAVRRKSRGTDVVVAAVEPRGREDVAMLLDGLEVIGDGGMLDPAAILARRPEVVFLDELTGPAATGESRLAVARHLAEAGIPVVATAQLSADPDGPDFGGPDFGGPDFGGADVGSADVGSADVGSPDLGGPDVGGPDVGGVDVGGADVGSADADGPDADSAGPGGAGHASTDPDSTGAGDAGSGRGGPGSAGPGGPSPGSASPGSASPGSASPGSASPGSASPGSMAAGGVAGPGLEGLDEATLLALADEIELIDVAPSALIERVRRGQIVPAGQVEGALAGAYAPAALSARRERAFRVVAQHGDRRLAAYRSGDRPGSGDPGRPPCVLACVAPEPGMEHLIRRAAALAAQVDGEFRAAAVTARPADDDPLLARYAVLTAQLGGELAILEDPSPAAALAGYAARHRVTELVLARGSGRPGRNPVLRDLAARPADLELHVLPAPDRR